MFTALLGTESIPKEPEHMKGERYKVVKTFELRYGYYGEKNRLKS